MAKFREVAGFFMGWPENLRNRTLPTLDTRPVLFTRPENVMETASAQFHKYCNRLKTATKIRVGCIR
jgi:hypothetical protein